jgi:pimeloyl-ACP methyl ester carboxylesterase
VEARTTVKPGTTWSFGPVRQVKAGVLDVGYAEAGPAGGRPVILLHGFPYDMDALKIERAILAGNHGPVLSVCGPGSP